MLDFAVHLARSAGALLAERFRSRENLDIRSKSPRNIVTQADIDAEKLIRGLIVSTRPDDAIVGEELEARSGSGLVWHIDPLDGTTNFAFGIPHWAVSVAAVQGNEIRLGAIYDPLRDELFTASSGGGAFLNGKPLRILPRTSLAVSLLGTGFASMRGEDPETVRCLDLFQDVIREVQGIRRLGSAALDLAYVAAGRLDLFFEEGLSSWDMAAGALIVSEAGGVARDYDGSDGFLSSGRIVAAAPEIAAEFIDRFRPSLR